MDKLEGQAEKQGLEQEAKGMMGGGGGGESGGENKAVNEGMWSLYPALPSILYCALGGSQLEISY